MIRKSTHPPARFANLRRGHLLPRPAPGMQTLVLSCVAAGMVLCVALVTL